jgi:acetyl-CoA synthetase
MSDAIETLLAENRKFRPSAEFVANANANDSQIYAEALKDNVAFWENWAEKLDWIEPWHTALEWNLPDAKWFVGGKLNACYNCVDRHLASNGQKSAIIWEGEPGEVLHISYQELHDQVCRVANALKAMGIAKGDRVCIYMPMVPELAYAMLACARIGAAHTVVFGGFSAESLAERINDCSCKAVITADGGYRRGTVVPLQKITEDALKLGCPTIENVLLLGRINPAVQMHAEACAPLGYQTNNPQSSIQNPKWSTWADLVAKQSTECPCEPMDSEDLLYILYTSGSTGKPKGIVHTTGGYMTGVFATFQWVFDHKPEDIFWCTADCGWVTGHSYVVYGPLANAATVVMYEGAPDTPDKDRFWRIIEKHKVTILYTAPTAIRTFMKWGDEYPNRCDLSSLRLLGSVGEPINPEAWMWYHELIGKSRCPIVDTWWQTETGAIMITPLPGITATKPGSATQPFPGIKAIVVNENGTDVTPIHGALGYYAHSSDESPPETGKAHGGILAITDPWPSMTRGIYGDPDRFRQVYWSRFPGLYFAGDGAKVDEEGNFWLLGRVDDIMLVAGHNISTTEVESALVDHHAVAEAAVIGRADAIKGQAIAAFVIIRSHVDIEDGLLAELKAHVSKKIGVVARPDDIYFCAELPKTRSGKIMRRLLKDVAEGRALGDTTTLADPSIVASLKDQYEATEA